VSQNSRPRNPQAHGARAAALVNRPRHAKIPLTTSEGSAALGVDLSIVLELDALRAARRRISVLRIHYKVVAPLRTPETSTRPGAT